MNIELPPQQQTESEVAQKPTDPPTKVDGQVQESKNSSPERRQVGSEECMKEARPEVHGQNRMEIEDGEEPQAQAQDDDNHSEPGNGSKKIEDQGTVEAKDKRKRAKKIKNLKCSECRKKRSGKDVISCKSCPRIFHLQCLNIDAQKAPRKYQCDKCRASLKEKEHKKKIKAAKLHEKIAIKMNSESKKTQKQLAELMRKLPPAGETDQGKQRLMTEFQYKYKYYVHKNKVVFPIEDDLFDQYPSILPKNSIAQKPQPTARLSQHFGTLLELWNCLQTFPENFQQQHKLSVSDLQTTIQHPKNLIFVQHMFLNLIKFFLVDIFNDKFEMNRHFTTNSFLALLRYCSENNAFDRIFRFVWVEFLEQISRLPDYQQIFNHNNRLLTIISNLRRKENEPWMPNSVADRYYLVKALLSGVVDTTSFHDSLYEKIEQGRQNTRQKNQYQENLKSEDNTLQTIKESIKNLEKELKEKQKALDMAGERANKPKLEKEVERVKESLDKLIEERDQATKNIEMYKQSIEYASNSTTHTSIWLLGQDKQRRSYWFMLDQRDKLFVNTPDQEWYYYDYHKINNQLTKCLNLKGVRQKNLYDTLISYRKSNYFLSSESKHNSNLQSVVFRMEEQKDKQMKEYAESGTFDFDKEKFINFRFIKNMLIEGERKIYAYLEERNARWSTPEDREIYIESIRAATKNQQIMEAVRYLNEKICVVEIEYKFVVEDDNQEVATYDSKTRKIQTKMWGINEKYKHAWLDYGKNAKTLLELFFLVAILYLTIERYVKKMRETRKIKKQIEEVKVQKQNKLLNKTDGDGKEIDASQWDELCGVCKKWGDLICCDMCPKVFHLDCIGLKEVPEGEFKCRQCQEKRQTRSRTKKIARTG